MLIQILVKPSHLSH